MRKMDSLPINAKEMVTQSPENTVDHPIDIECSSLSGKRIKNDNKPRTRKWSIVL